MNVMWSSGAICSFGEEEIPRPSGARRIGIPPTGRVRGQSVAGVQVDQRTYFPITHHAVDDWVQIMSKLAIPPKWNRISCVASQNVGLVKVAWAPFCSRIEHVLPTDLSGRALAAPCAEEAT